jgi:hypothetical protein
VRVTRAGGVRCSGLVDGYRPHHSEGINLWVLANLWLAVLQPGRSESCGALSGPFRAVLAPASASDSGGTPSPVGRPPRSAAAAAAAAAAVALRVAASLAAAGCTKSGRPRQRSRTWSTLADVIRLNLIAPGPNQLLVGNQDMVEVTLHADGELGSGQGRGGEGRVSRLRVHNDTPAQPNAFSRGPARVNLVYRTWLGSFRPPRLLSFPSLLQAASCRRLATSGPSAAWPLPC